MQYTMIAGGGEPRGEFERIYRLGYDATRIHVNWTKLEPGPGKYDFTQTREWFAKISGEGLKIGLRPHSAGIPAHVREKAPPPSVWKDGADTPLGTPDTAHPCYRERVVKYYAALAQMASEYPAVTSINANYLVASSASGAGLHARGGLHHSPERLRLLAGYLEKHYTPGEFNRRAGFLPKTFADVTPEMIVNDKSRTLLPAYTRVLLDHVGELEREVAKAVREAGFRGHLAFNTNYHPSEQALLGQPATASLRASREFFPGSVFHETSDRYCLSFAKWLAAKRTLDLPYGDEGCLNPPPYEQNLLAYHWMGMMQCFDSLYCQWFGGRPATQNIAFIKPYHQILYNAEYLPDPVCLATALDYGVAASPDIFKASLHQSAMAHYGLANLFRAANINPDRYLLAEFPEADANVKTKLLVDDISKEVSAGYGDRLEKFIRDGGVFIASLDTDKLNAHAFLERFGLTVTAGKLNDTDGAASVQTGTARNYLEKNIGARGGKIIVLQGTWANGGFDPGGDPGMLAFARELFVRHGGFTPQVTSDTVNVFVTPYRAGNGDLLLHVLNITSARQTTIITAARRLAPAARTLTNHDTGAVTPVDPGADDTAWRATVTLPPLNATVLRLSET
ncbi:MAG: beta-galactosidase [Opitutaceae bacterium]|jgi:hypothetical protein|nr:beta-galactosidase [Opitutaceae bacterium]